MQTLVALLPHLLIAANTILMLALFFGINQRVRKAWKRLAAGEMSVDGGITRISNATNELCGRLAKLEKEVSGLKNSERGAAALNGAVRAQMLKMYRMGQPADRIAETLRVPRSEVDLLVKVHGIVMQSLSEHRVAGDGDRDVEKRLNMPQEHSIQMLAEFIAE